MIHVKPAWRQLLADKVDLTEYQRVALGFPPQTVVGCWYWLVEQTWHRWRCETPLAWWQRMEAHDRPPDPNPS